MFANILLLSLLTIIYGTKGEEGGGGSAVDTNAVNFLPDVSQQRSNDGRDKYLFLSPVIASQQRTPTLHLRLVRAAAEL
jgi:hypothetical protein